MRAIPLRLRSSPLSRLKSRVFSGNSTAWWIALACAVLGILTGLNIVIVPFLAGYSYWIVLGGLILLLVTTR